MADRTSRIFPGPRPVAARKNSPPNDTHGEQRPDPTPSRGIAPVDIARERVHSRGRLEAVPPPSDMAMEQGAALRFTVPGKPLPHGSKDRVPITRGGRVVAHKIVESGDRDAKAAWRADIRHVAHQAMGGRPLMEGPLAMSVCFYLRRPQSHHGTGRNEGKLKPSAPAHVTKMPDVLKLARGLEDSLSGICYRDDAQIVDEHLHKRYDNDERTEVLIAKLESPGTGT